ncbi:DotU family type VI secretion system protein [Pseudomonas sp. RIT-PI-AD]|uniref:DotU family type VI secretion system protein n=1 Tax=Pseudomonas sp. RIT-PI-AD TaxID=3035294 RepID=UPI0021DA40BA|nr:DotU family type VI secretion system protein [Pseudomonas sp. RIT-PI-AD]
MAELDPFNAGKDRTFVMPNPGGESPGNAGTHERSRAPEFDLPEVHSGSNPLVAAANPLLNLIYQIRTLVHNSEPARLRDFLTQEVRNFEARAKFEGISQEHLIAARYCLCTVLDETAAQTPWGGSGVWSRHSLLVTFHNETWGGEKFFQLLAKLAQSPMQHRDLLELMYYCISLGFEGRYRIISNGQSQLETLRRRLAEIIRDAKGDRFKALSPHWEGVTNELPKVWRVMPVWVSTILGLLLGTAIYMVIAFYLSDRSDKTFAAINGLKLPEAPVVERNTAPPVRFARFLEPEIRAGLVSVKETSEQSTVTILGDGLFDSGSASVRSRYYPILQRIAEAINETHGKVLVTGHSDDVPIRTVRFPSNWHLSMERATTVSALLEKFIDTSGRVTTQGRGSSEPVVPNASAANRALNRRVEITVFASPADLQKEIR